MEIWTSVVGEMVVGKMGERDGLVTTTLIKWRLPTAGDIIPHNFVNIFNVHIEIAGALTIYGS